MQKIAIVVFLVVVVAFSVGNCELTSASVSDGACPEYFAVAKNIDSKFVYVPQTYYIPFASEFSYRTTFEAFNNGSSAANAGELNAMKPTVEWVSGTSIYRGCVDKQVEFNCTELANPSSTSSPTGSTKCDLPSTEANPSQISSVTATVVLTDNQSYIMIAGCLANNEKGFAVLSIGKTLSSAAEADARKEAKALGFSAKHFKVYEY